MKIALFGLQVLSLLIFYLTVPRGEEILQSILGDSQIVLAPHFEKVLLIFGYIFSFSWIVILVFRRRWMGIRWCGALFYLLVILTGGFAALHYNMPLIRHKIPRITLKETSPDGQKTAYLVDHHYWIDRNFQVIIKEKGILFARRLLYSPDESYPKDEKILWSGDSTVMVLHGSYDASSKYYLVHDFKKNRTYCNAGQLARVGRISDTEVEELLARREFSNERFR